MRVGSLFAGGGLGDFGWVTAGYDIAWQCEIDPWCQKILALRYPESQKHTDIKQLKGSELEKVDIIAGGFPCQGFSVAGKKRGKEDERYLWPEMLRVIRECGPRWVCGENVPGIINMALDTVCSDLEAEGYEVWPLVFPSHALGAWHKRDRVWIIAYRDDNQSEQQECNPEGRRCSSEPWSSNGVGAGSRIKGGNTSKGDEDIGGGSTVLSPVMAKSSVERCDNGWDNRGERSVLYNKDGNASEDKSEGDKRKRGASKISKAGEQTSLENSGCELQQGSIKQGTHGVEVEKQDANISERPSKTHGKIIPNSNSEGLQGSSEARDTSSKGSNPKQFSSGYNPFRKYWESEPRLGGRSNGYPDWLDFHITKEMSNAVRVRYCQELRTLWNPAISKVLWKTIGGFNRIQKAEILFSFMCEYENNPNKAWLLLESKKALEEFVRSLWLYGKITGSSHRPESGKQQEIEHTDSMQILSRLLAHNLQEDWSISGWEDGIPRVASGVKDRVHRLKALGNGQVPVNTYVIGRMIMEVEATYGNS